MRVLNQSPNKKILLRFVEKYHHSLYLVEKLVLGCGLSLVFLVVLFFVFLFPKNFYFSSENKSFGVCTRTFFFASFENILPVRFVREEERRDGK